MREITSSRKPISWTVWREHALLGSPRFRYKRHYGYRNRRKFVFIASPNSWQISVVFLISMGMRCLPVIWIGYIWYYSNLWSCKCFRVFFFFLFIYLSIYLFIHLILHLFIFVWLSFFYSLNVCLVLLKQLIFISGFELIPKWLIWFI